MLLGSSDTRRPCLYRPLNNLLSISEKRQPLISVPTYEPGKNALPLPKSRDSPRKFTQIWFPLPIHTHGLYSEVIPPKPIVKTIDTACKW